MHRFYCSLFKGEAAFVFIAQKNFKHQKQELFMGTIVQMFAKAVNVTKSGYNKLKIYKALIPLTAVTCLVDVNKASAQLFQQQFSSGTVSVSNGAVSDNSTFVNTTSPSNSQFTDIRSSNSNTTVSVTNSQLRIARGSSGIGSFARNVAFSGSPTSLLIRMDITTSNHSVASTSTGIFYIGTNSLGNNTTSPTNSDVYARFAINLTPTAGTFAIRDITNMTNGADITGQQTITWALNNSGSNLTYKAPNNSYETIANDKADLWVGTIKMFDDVNIQNALGNLSFLKFIFNTNSAATGTIDIDNILIDHIPATPVSNQVSFITANGFTANWSTVPGVTGYRLDVATDAAFTNFVTGYNGLLVSGQSTASKVVAGLSQGTQYYYRVRAESQYTVDAFTSGNSGSQSVTTCTVPSQPAAFTTSSSPICQGQMGITYTVPNDATATSYNWTYSGTGVIFTSTINSVNINFNASATSGTLSVTASNSCGTSTSRTFDITVNPTPTLTSASQAAPVCIGTTATINLTGLVASSTATVSYSINGTPQTAASVTADASGNGSFTTPMLAAANNAQTLQITGITITSAMPNCSATFAQNLILAVNNCPPVTQFYVNDNSTVGDGYTGSIGNDGNPGTQASPFATIGHAIAVAPAGSTVFVDAGTYNESVIVNKALILKGKQAGALGKGRTGAEAVLDPASSTANGFKIVADNVTIDGFTITNSAAYPSGNPIPERSGVVTIEKAGAGNFTGIVVKNNVITRQFKAVNFNYTDNFEISGNWLHGEGDDYNYGCMWIASYGTASTTGLITNNDLDGYSSAVEIQGDATHPVSNLTVSENRSTGSQYVLFGLQNSSVYRNTVLNVTTGSHVYIGGGCTNSTFSQNFFDSGLYSGVRIANPFGAGINSNLTVTNNSITGHNSTGYYEINVDASAYSGSLTATCNWFGSTNNAVIAPKINGPVMYTPYLTNGTDNDLSAAGFQSMPGSCNSNQTEFYVDDNSNSGDVYTTTATGSDVTGNGTQAAPYATIAKAISVAPSGATIYVDAGTYAENVTVNKSLTILGSNASINPNTGTRVAEAVVVPATNNVASGRIFDVNANNVTIKGFTVDGDNTTISGGYNANGADNNAAFGIACGDDPSPDGFNNILVENNVIKNLGNATAFNAAFYGSGSQSGSRTGSNVQNNKINNTVLWGIVTENNFYTNVQNNVITRTGRGIQFDNTWIAGVPVSIANNSVKYYRRGILVNLRYGAASPVTVSGNTIQPETAGIQEDGTTGAAAINRGLMVWSIAAGGGNVTLTDNNISNAWYGEELWNNAPGKVSQTGGVLNNNQYGIYLPTNQDAYGNAAYGSNASITRVTISNSVADGVWLNDNNSTDPNSINLSLTNAFITDGVNNVRIAGNDVVATINNNSFTGSSAKAIDASAFTNATPVNATCNWYGTTNGTLVSSKVSGTVTYAPYLTNGSDSDPSTAGFQPTAGSCNGPAVLTELYVDDNSDAGDVYTPGVTGNDATGDGSQTAPFATIAKALTVAANGNTIYVDAGTYGETVMVNKQVVIKGAQAGVLAKGRSGAETVLDPASSAANGFKVVTDNVTIDGFTITNSAAYASGERSGVVTIEKTGTGNFSGITIKNNVISRQFKAINFNATDNFEISGNWLHGESDAYNYGCMWIASYGTSSANGVVFNNDLDGYSSAVEVQGNAAQPVSNLTVSSNRSTGCQYVFFGLQNSNVYRNTVLNVTTGSHVYIGGGCTNSTFSQNFFDGGTSNGIRIENAYGAGVNSGLTVTNNSITGHTAAGKYEINVDATGYSGTLSATCNWFGSDNNAVVSSKVSGPVTYQPYLTSGTDSGPSTPGFQPAANACNSGVQFYVNDNANAGDTYTTGLGNDANSGSSSSPFATISHAVSVAPAGAKIYVDAGTYEEQVIVNKSLDIIGAGRSGGSTTKIQAPNTVPSQPTANGTTRAIVLATGLSNTVNISKVLVDGRGVGGVGFTGVYYDEASGTFADSRITAIRDALYSGVQSGDAFVADHEYYVSKPQTVTVNNNIIDDYQKSGIVIDEQDTRGIVTNNTVTGQNIKNVNGQNGIQFAFGAYGTITGNTVSNNLYNDATNAYVATGILIAGVGVNNSNASTGYTTTVSNNTLTNNDAGLYSDAGGYGYDSNAGLTEGPNAYNLNYTHVSINAPAVVPNASNVYDKRVDNTAETNTVYGQIQRAVDYASAGHTLNASAHTFTEQVEIRKDLTLNGVAGGTKILSPAVLPLSFATNEANKAIVYVHDAAAVTVQNLTVDGAGKGNANYRFEGIAYFNAGGTVQNTSITGIRNTPLDGMQAGVGLYAWADTGTARTLVVNNNVVNDYQKNGMTFRGSKLTATVTNNTVTGSGPLNFIAQNGIQLSYGSKGSITGNAVSNIGYITNTDTWSAGVLLYQVADSTLVKNNTVTNVQAGIYSIGSKAGIVENNISNTAAGMGAIGNWYGVVVEDGNAAVKQNTLNNGGKGNGVRAEYYSGETTNVTVANNFIANAGAGVVVYTDGSGGTASVLINENSITSVDTAIYNAGSSQQYATCNWYGTADNSLIAPKIKGLVTYQPYLTNGTDNSAAAGFQPVPGSCNGPVLSVSVTAQTNVSCYGNSTGSVTVAASGGNPGYQYSIDGTNYQASATFNGLAAGTYTVTVKDNAAATAAVSVTITQPTAALTLTASQINNACHGGTNGSITATGSGGTAGTGYQYSLSGPVNAAYSSNNSFTNLPSGTYTVMVKDANGCTAQVSKTITEPSGTRPDVTLSVADYSDNFFPTNNTNVTLIFQVSEVGGNPALNDLLRITKQGGYTFTLLPGSTATVGGTPYALDNSRWTADDTDPNFFRVSINSGQQVNCGQSVYLGVSLSRTTPSKSVFNLTAQMRGVSNENNSTNNSTTFLLVGQ